MNEVHRLMTREMVAAFRRDPEQLVAWVRRIRWECDCAGGGR